MKNLAVSDKPGASNMQPSVDVLDRLTCATLRGEAPAWAIADDDALVTKAFLEYAGYHGVGPLLSEAMSDSNAWSSWPAKVRETLVSDYQALTALEMLRRRELSSILKTFQESGVRTLLLKGTALAYELYPNPALRTRTDTDVLIQPQDKNTAGKLLEQLGYHRPAAITGQYVSTQSLYLKRELSGVHAIDLHWQISNSLVFAQQFDFDALWAGSCEIAALCEGAYALSTIDALLHACLHRAVHIPHGEEDRLLWFYDMHLLGARLDKAQWTAFAEQAAEKEMRTVCADALKRCTALLGTPVPDEVMTVLSAPTTRREMSAGLLRGGGFNTAYIKYRSLPNWRARIALLREEILPPASYMRARYDVHARLPLASAYLRRLLAAPNKLMAKAHQPNPVRSED